MVIRWEKELLLTVNIKKRPIYVADDVVVVHIMFATKIALLVDLAPAKKLEDIAGKTRRLIRYA